MSAQTIQDYLVKPATCAAIAAASTVTLQPGYSVIVGSRKIPVWQIEFGGVFIGSVVAELFHDYLFPHIPKIGKLVNAPLTEAIAVGAIAATEMGILHYINPDALEALGLPTLVAQAAMGRIAGSYVADNFLKPLVDSAMSN